MTQWLQDMYRKVMYIIFPNLPILLHLFYHILCVCLSLFLFLSVFRKRVRDRDRERNSVPVPHSTNLPNQHLCIQLTDHAIQTHFVLGPSLS